MRLWAKEDNLKSYFTQTCAQMSTHSTITANLAVTREKRSHLSFPLLENNVAAWLFGKEIWYLHYETQTVEFHIYLKSWMSTVRKYPYILPII